MAQVLVALGSNVGDREAHLKRALDRLKELPTTTVERVSRWIETDPIGGPPQGKFLNGAALLATDLTPLELMKALQAIELSLGRPLDRPKNHPRSIDLDMLSYDNLVLETPELTLPHPRLHERLFVLGPLHEIAPEWTHPVLKKKPGELIWEFQCGSSGV